MQDQLDAVRENIFPGAHAAIADWASFPWHRDRNNRIDSHQPHSSQALAIDVFGTVAAHASRDAVMAALAADLGIPGAGPWSIEFEWTDPDHLLGEPRPTQVDVMAAGRAAAIAFECKFTEPGGGCSQPSPLRSGVNGGVRQCNGAYETQINVVNGIEARCALSAKGIRYWEHIPLIFDLDPTSDYRPCPFAGDAFQWMRNSLLADRIGKTRGLATRVVAAFADAPTFPTAKKAKSGQLGLPVIRAEAAIIPLSYQTIAAKAWAVSGDRLFEDLSTWIERKISGALSRGKERRPHAQ